MDVTVFGATGAIGQQVVEQLRTRGHAVTACVRNPAEVPAGWGQDVTVVIGEITDAAAIDRAVARADAVVSAPGPSMDRKATGLPLVEGTQLIVHSMQRHRVRRHVGNATPMAGQLESGGLTVLELPGCEFATVELVQPRRAWRPGPAEHLVVPVDPVHVTVADLTARGLQVDRPGSPTARWTSGRRGSPIPMASRLQPRAPSAVARSRRSVGPGSFRTRQRPGGGMTQPRRGRCPDRSACRQRVVGVREVDSCGVHLVGHLTVTVTVTGVGEVDDVHDLRATEASDLHSTHAEDARGLRRRSGTRLTCQLGFHLRGFAGRSEA